jgi:polysaccharide pyruvyl transferase CsaB
MRRYRVALIGYYGFGNLGDELLAEASIAALLRCGVERERIVILSNAPDDSRRKFGVDAVNRWKIRQVLRTLGQSETLLLGGGGLFQDTTSLLSCVYYWGLIRCASVRGAPPWALGQSVGPLSTSWGRRLTRDALKRCRVLQVRERTSASLCEALGLPVDVGHDLTFSLGDAFQAEEAGTTGTPPLLLVNLRPAGDLSNRFAEAVAAYARSFHGEVVGVAFSQDDERLMVRLVDEGRLSLSRVERVTTLSDAVRIFRGAKAAVGMRLHFTLLASMARIPSVAVPYDPKVESFAASARVPLWREGSLPSPQVPLPSPAPEIVRQEIDALCRRVLLSPARLGTPGV